MEDSSPGKEARMRLLTQIACLISFILVSGCSMGRNPFSRDDRSYATHNDREIERRLADGDYDAAIKGIEKLRREKELGTPRISSVKAGSSSLTPRDSTGVDDLAQTPFQQQLPGVSATEIDSMIEQLVLLEPVSMREQKRAVYRQMSPSTLRQIVAGYEQANLIGQSRIAADDLDQARERINNSGAMNTIQNAGFPEAPNPRNIADNRPLGIDSPWDQRQTQRNEDDQPFRMRDPRQVAPIGSETGPGGSRLRPAAGFSLPDDVGSGPGDITQIGGTTSDIGRLTNAGRSNSQLPQNNSQLPQINPAGTAPFKNNPFTPSFGSEFNNSPGATKSGPNGVQLLTPQNVDQGQNNLQGTGIDPSANQQRPRYGIGIDRSSATSTVPGIGEPAFPSTARGNVPPDTPFDQLTNKPSVGTNPNRDTANQLPTDNLTPQTNAGNSNSASSFPGRISNSMQNIIPSIRNAAERTLPTFPGIGLGGPAAGSLNSAGPAEIQDSMTLAIQTLEQQLASTAPGRTEQERLDYVRQHVGLRTLYLIAGRNEQALVSIPGAEPTDQEFWQQMMWSVASYFDAQGVPNSSDRATQTIGQLRAAVQQLRSRANLELNNVAFCYKIDGFGHYDRFSRDRFKSAQPILLYAELKNFQSTLVEGDRFRTVMNSGIEIYRGTGNQELLGSIPFDVTEDLCRTQREDYFLAFEFSVPERLEAGTYTLVLKVEDQLSRKTAMSQLNFVVE